MKETSDLFDLIKSLSKSEKRALTMAMTQNKGDKEGFHLKLFHGLDKQHSYKPGRLDGLIQNENMQLPYLKHYLFQFILKKLRDYHSGHSFETKLYEQLIELDILYSKQLYGLAHKKLAKLAEEAEKAEKFEVLLICHQWYRKITRFIGPNKGKIEILDKQDVHLKMLNELNDFRDLYWQMNEFAKKVGRIRKKEDERWIRDFLKSPLLNEKYQPLSNSSYLLYCQLKSSAYDLLHEQDKSIAISKKRLGIYEKILVNDSSVFINYTDACCDHILYLLRAKRFIEAIDSYTEFKQLRVSAKAKQWKFKIEGPILSDYMYKCMERELAIYGLSGHYEEFMDLVKKSDYFMGKLEFQLPIIFTMVLYYDTAWISFVMGDYKQTIKYLNKILNYSTSETFARSNIYSMSKLLFLIVHYELKTVDLPGYLLKSTYRFLYRHKRIYEVEDALLLFIRNKLLKNTRPQLLIKDFIELKAKLEKITEKQFEKNILEFFDFIAWLESKITGKSFLEIMQNKYYWNFPPEKEKQLANLRNTK
jgi:hypothetical protein